MVFFGNPWFLKAQWTEMAVESSEKAHLRSLNQHRSIMFFWKRHFLPEGTDTGIHLFSAFYCYARKFYNNLSILNFTWSHSSQCVIVPSPLSWCKNAFSIMFPALPTCLPRQIFPGASAFAVQWTWPWVENKIQLSSCFFSIFSQKHLISI